MRIDDNSHVRIFWQLFLRVWVFSGRQNKLRWWSNFLYTSGRDCLVLNIGRVKSICIIIRACRRWKRTLHPLSSIKQFNFRHHVAASANWIAGYLATTRLNIHPIRFWCQIKCRDIHKNFSKISCKLEFFPKSLMSGGFWFTKAKIRSGSVVIFSSDAGHYDRILYDVNYHSAVNNFYVEFPYKK